jgi:hypothetical protein
MKTIKIIIIIIIGVPYGACTVLNGYAKSAFRKYQVNNHTMTNLGISTFHAITHYPELIHVISLRWKLQMDHFYGQTNSGRPHEIYGMVKALRCPCRRTPSETCWSSKKRNASIH